jgi:hypothetical protein
MTKNDDTKNPHDTNSPEWQLWAQSNAGRLLIVAADEDVKRAQRARASAVARVDAYAIALKMLGHPVVADKKSK